MELMLRILNRQIILDYLGGSLEVVEEDRKVGQRHVTTKKQQERLNVHC